MIEWHPYPKSKPPKEGKYLVWTYRLANEFCGDIDTWDGTWKYYVDGLVMAWAEITPYKPQTVQNKAQNKGIITHAGRKLRLPIKRIEK